MSKRASLPRADELFRRTSEPSPPVEEAERETSLEVKSISRQIDKFTDVPDLLPGRAETAPVRPRHEEKITFYCTAQELDEIESVRLRLRREQRLGVDRGRIIRAAVAEALEDYVARGEDSALARRIAVEKS